jgi:hypothetical protein
MGDGGAYFMGFTLAIGRGDWPGENRHYRRCTTALPDFSGPDFRHVCDLDWLRL